MRRKFPVWLILALTALLPIRAVAVTPPDWETLQRDRQELEESATQTRTDEQTAVSELFALNRTLEETRMSIAKLDTEILELSGQQAEAEAEAERLKARRKERQAQFARRVRYYHEQGTFAPIGFLLESGSFSDFLFRIEFLSMVLEQDAKLSRELRDLTAKAEAQEQVLATKKAEVASARDKQRAEVDRLDQEVAKKEAFLAGLREQRSAVEAKAAELEQIWSTAARPVLEAFGKSLQTVALKIGDLEPDSVSFSLVPPGATVKVGEERLNDFLTREGELKGLLFDLKPGQANLEGEFGGVKMSITGRFVMKSKTVLRYEPQEVRFHGVTLPHSLTDELLSAGRLDMDFADLVGVWSVKEVRMEEGAMVVVAGLR